MTIETANWCIWLRLIAWELLLISEYFRLKDSCVEKHNLTAQTQWRLHIHTTPTIGPPRKWTSLDPYTLGYWNCQWFSSSPPPSPWKFNTDTGCPVSWERGGGGGGDGRRERVRRNKYFLNSKTSQSNEGRDVLQPPQTLALCGAFKQGLMLRHLNLLLFPLFSKTCPIPLEKACKTKPRGTVDLNEWEVLKEDTRDHELCGQSRVSI